MKQGNPAVKEASLLYDVSEAFREVGDSAKRIAYGGKAVCDLSAGGRLARLAKQAAESAKPSPDCSPDYPDPLAELAGTVEALREIAGLHGRAGDWKHGSAFGRLVQEEFDWCHDLGLRIDGGPDCVIRGDDDAGPEALRRTMAARLAADCKVCGAVAQQKADALLWIAALRSGCEAREAEARLEVAKVTKELHRARAETWEAKAELHPAGSVQCLTMKKRAEEERRKESESSEKVADLEEETQDWQAAAETIEKAHAAEVAHLREQIAMGEETSAQLAQVVFGQGKKILENTDLLLAVATGLADKAARADALVFAFNRFFGEVRAGTPPGGKVACAHFNNFILDARNRAALGRAKAWRTFRLKYGEWLDWGRPGTGKEYLEKLKAAKRQKRKAKRAGG